MGDVLFSIHGRLSDYLSQLEELAGKLVEDMPDLELLDQPAEAHAQKLLRLLMPQTPRLMLEQVVPRMETSEEETIAKFVVPFSGTGALLNYTPSGMTETPPPGKVAGALIVTIPTTEEGTATAEAIFKDTVTQIERWLELVAREVAPLEPKLAARLEQPLAERQRRVAEDLGVDMVSYRAQAGAEVPRISLAELRAMVQAQAEVRLVDVLGEDHWKRGHLPGSEWLDFARLAREAKRRFRPDERLVVYCTGAG